MQNEQTMLIDTHCKNCAGGKYFTKDELLAQIENALNDASRENMVIIMTGMETMGVFDISN